LLYNFGKCVPLCRLTDILRSTDTQYVLCMSERERESDCTRYMSTTALSVQETSAVLLAVHNPAVCPSAMICVTCDTDKLQEHITATHNIKNRTDS
jgi:hypothetical protein